MKQQSILSLAPAKIGDPVDEVDTPALLIELDAFERNLQTMADDVTQSGVRLRPHAKTHKSAVIAQKQVALGAVGACCQTVAEAEILVHGGVNNVIVSNQVVGVKKIERLVALAREAQIGVCVDDLNNISALGTAAQEASVNVNVLIEIEVGMGRCGVLPGQPALGLAQPIDSTPGLHFAGLQAYQGAAQHIRNYDERRSAIDSATILVRQTVDLFADKGLKCEIIGGAGTGTYPFEANSGIYNELQAGSYIFMDVDYAKNKNQDGTNFNKFEHSLFVLTTIISRPSETRAVVDAGLKAHSTDSGLPLIHGANDIRYLGASDEHGVLELQGSSPKLRVGDKLRLIPGHCDPTVNLYDWYVGIRNERVEEIWPIALSVPDCFPSA